MFLLNQSFSMEGPLGGTANRKCDKLASAINVWLQNMTILPSGEEGIKDWIDVGVLGYRTDAQANPIIESALQGAPADRWIVSVAQLGANPARIDTKIQHIPNEQTGEMIEVPCEVPVWVDPKAKGGSPMCHVLYRAHETLNEWIGHHHNSFPPIVVNITDGRSQDGDPTPYAEAVRALSTNDGNVLLMNCHLSTTAADPLLFPTGEKGLPDELAWVLFRTSSVLPEPFHRYAVTEEVPLQKNARGMAFNTDMAGLVQFLNVTAQVVLRLR